MGVELDVEEKRVLLNSDMYELDISLPAKVQIDDCAAQFDCTTKYLHLSMSC